MNGVYRAPPLDEYTERLVEWANGQGLDWPEERARGRAAGAGEDHPAA